MKKEDLKELHYITHIDNLLSILKGGILCHEKSKKIRHQAVSDPKVQKRRAKVVIPGGKKLHSYANLYFNARNPMMRVLVGRHKHSELAVLQIDLSILDKPEVVISDRNASSIDYVRFYTAKSGLTKLDKDVIFTKYWTDPNNPFRQYELKSSICAEVLVPDCITPEFITGIYVSCEESLQRVKKLLTNTPFVDKITVNSDLFFQ
ncbi:MAG: DUF4433 domain-containing protein [Planctomycetota bacterium]|nr:DUF4433 domain-containing protein [Planctomycetota bacterium]MDI6786773.1 DUF4433 domain-containing protein [Planctomycetota bacterium]